MINLMDFQSKRIINIIHHLANKNAQLTVNDIAFMNDCSEKTVYNDIKFIQNSWDNLLGIDRHNNVFIAKIKSQAHVKYIFSQILVNSNAAKILIAIFMKPNQSIHYYATITNTSITNLYNTIKVINDKLQFYNINIINKNRTFKIQAETDDHVLLFFTMLFLETEVQEQYRCQDVIKTIDKRLQKVFQDQYESIALRDFYNAYYYVSLLYLKNNKHAFNKHTMKENIIIEKDPDLYNDLRSFFPSLPEQGFNYIEAKIDQTCKLKEKRNLTKEKEIKLFLVENLKELSNLLDEDRLNKMIEILFITVNGFIVPDVKITHFINRYESFSARIQARSPKSHQHLIEMFETLGIQFNLRLEHSLHYLIYWTTLTFHDIHYVRDKRILVISDHNQIHADYLKDHIQMQLGSYQYDSYYLHDCYNWKNNIDEDQYFRIISTNKLKDISQEKLIVIGDYIGLDDLAEIFNHLGNSMHDPVTNQIKDIHDPLF